MRSILAVLTIVFLMVSFSGQVLAQGGVYSIGQSVSLYTNSLPDGTRYEWVVKTDGDMVVYDIFWSESFMQLDNFNCTKGLQKVSELEPVKKTGYYLVQVDSLTRSILEVPAEMYQNTVVEFDSGLIYVSNMRTRWYQAEVETCDPSGKPQGVPPDVMLINNGSCDPNCGPPPPPCDQMLVTFCDPGGSPPPVPTDNMLANRRDVGEQQIFDPEDPHGQFIIDPWIGSPGY